MARQVSTLQHERLYDAMHSDMHCTRNDIADLEQVMDVNPSDMTARRLAMLNDKLAEQVMIATQYKAEIERAKRHGIKFFDRSF